MFIDTSTINALLQNPQVLAALIAILRNVGGYVYNCLEARTILPYSAMQMLETLALWETFFTMSSTVAGLPLETTTILTIAADIVRTVRKAVENLIAALKTSKPS